MESNSKIFLLGKEKKDIYSKLHYSLLNNAVRAGMSKHTLRDRTNGRITLSAKAHTFD